MMARDDRDALRLLRGLGEVYLRGGQADRARVLLLLAAQIEPDDRALLRSLARAFSAAGDGARALAALDRLQALGEADPGLALLRSRALWLAGRHADARRCFLGYQAARREAAVC